MFALLAQLPAAPAQYPGWQHSGSFYILTTAAGANLPAAALEHDFPLLVRLHKDWFDFSQAKAGGEDIRFTTATGEPLASQTDEWDANAGTAAIWVRIPTIQGQAKQEIKMFWGKPDAASESNGAAVFNESNGYLSVWHMGGVLKEEAGGLAAKDAGTQPAPGRIGRSRHFPEGKGIVCGENITTFPAGSSPHTTEAWFRPEKPNATVLAWGNEAGQGKVMMQFFSPAHVKVECYFSGADVEGGSSLAMSQWIHVAHAFKNGDSRIYVNGVLDGVSRSTGAPLAIKSPARMYIGGWYDNYRFAGDIDEVRISKVTRSADWIRMEYENQKPLQTLVGPLMSAGTAFSVSENRINLLEGQRAAVSAQAGGAQKVYWILKNGDQTTIAAVDRFHFILDAGRVLGDRSLTLQFKAIYSNDVKTLDIPVTIQEDIPEPVFTLKAPGNWDGRGTIEVVPQIANLTAMAAKGAGELKYSWTVSGLAVIQETAPGKLILKRSQNSGKLTVATKVDNGGQSVTQAIEILVKEPPKDVWVQRTPGRDEKPEDNQFYARDDGNEGTLYYNGSLGHPVDSVFLKVYADETLIQTERQTLKAGNAYAIAIKLKAGLIRYKVEFGSKTGEVETVLHSAHNLVCGDAYVIDGQSNAVAYNYHNLTNSPLIGYTSDWIRCYGSNGEAGDDTTNGGWGNAVLTNRIVNSRGGVHFIGVWGMVLARQLVEDEKIPICILNGAVGGTRIDQHLPDPADRYGTANSAHFIYRNLLKRVVAARLTHGIRGVLWHQGEADQGVDGPDNGYGWETHQQYFVDLSAAWKQDMPNLQHYYLFQIWPNACGQGGNRHSDKLRDVQRLLSRLYSNLSVMPTLDFPTGAGCHFNLADYEKMGLSMVRLVERNHYERVFRKPVTAPDLQQAHYATGRNDEMVLEFDQPMAWNPALASLFYLDGQEGLVRSGSASGNRVTLQLASPATAKTITYLVDKKWDHKNLLYGENGIAALTFCEAPVSPAKPAH